MIIIGQVRDYPIYKQHFELKDISPNITTKNWCIKPGNTLEVISCLEPKELITVDYGMPNLKKNSYHYEASIDGDSSEQVLKKRILTNKDFSYPLRFRRCIVPCDYFILTHNQKAFLVFSEDRSPLGLAGIFNPSKDGSYYGCSILTFRAYGMFQRMDMERVPLILHNRTRRWLRKTEHLMDITDMMLPYPDKSLNAYPVDYELIATNINERIVAEPSGSFFRKRELKIQRLKKNFNKKREDNNHSWSDWNTKKE